MTGGIHRAKDITDIIELIKATALPLAIADELNPFVADRYRELWHGLQQPSYNPSE